MLLTDHQILSGSLKLHMHVGTSIDEQEESNLNAYGEEIAVLEEGDVIGEIALMLRQPSKASAVAQGATSLLALPRRRFTEMQSDYPDVRIKDVLLQLRYFLQKIQILISEAQKNSSASRYDEVLEVKTSVRPKTLNPVSISSVS